MIRTDCPCLDCKRNNAIAAAAEAPIHGAGEETPNEGQVKAWVQIAHEVFVEYRVNRIPLPSLASMVAQRIPGLRAENYNRVLFLIGQALKSHPDFEYRRGASGGIFKREVAGGTDRSVVYAEATPRGFAKAATLIDEMSKAPKEVQDHALRMIKSGTLPPPMPEVVAINDHICPGCGNNKCSKTERTCWKCGGTL